MKANIAADGTMTVRAETDLERYALTKWFSDWKEKKAVFGIDVKAEPNVTKSSGLEPKVESY